MNSFSMAAWMLFAHLILGVRATVNATKGAAHQVGCFVTTGHKCKTPPADPPAAANQ